jgi:hypothetical protein
MASRAAAPTPTPVSSAKNAANRRKKEARLVYQYSVVPGGVRDTGELVEAVAHDPSVALHYAKFDFQRARLVRLGFDRRMYISYRRNGQILWTRTAHLIRAGEQVITDGKLTARTRCGNRLAAKPEGLTAPEEPTEAQLNEPVAVAGEPVRPPVTLLQRSTLMPPLVASGPGAPPSGGIPILIGPPVGGGGGGTVCETEKEEQREHDTDTNELICPKKHHPPPPSVPEPGTLVLVGSGIALFGRRYLMDRLRRRTS